MKLPPSAAAFPARFSSFLRLMALLTSRASLLWKPVLRSAAASLFGLQNRRPFFVFANDRDVFLETPPGAFLPAADAFFFDFNGVCIRPKTEQEAERE